MHKTFIIAIFIVLGGYQLFGQTPAQIYQQATPVSNPMDPNGDGYITADGTPFTTDENNLELPFVSIPQLNTEPSGDLSGGGSCGSTDVVDNPNSGAEASFVYFDDQDGIPDNGDEIMVYRLRLAKNATGAFGFSVLIDTDGCFGFGPGGCPNDPNAVTRNPGFEYEIRYKTGGSGSGVYVDYVDGTTAGTNVAFYPESGNTQRSYALFNDATCTTSDPVFFDFFIPISDLALNSSSSIRLAAATATSPSSVLGNSVSDVAGIDDVNYEALYGANWLDSAMVKLIELQEPTPLSNLDETGCFINGTSDTPVISSPVFDSQTFISGTSTEPDGAGVELFVNGTSIGTTTVTAGSWIVNLTVTDLQTFDQVMVAVKDSCEIVSPYAVIYVSNDEDSDNDGILDIDEGNGADPGGDNDGDRIPNYLDVQYPGFTDSNNDGVNDFFDNDGDAIPNHLDTDSDNDGVSDIIENGGIALDVDNDGQIDDTTDTDQDGIPDVVDADNGGSPLPMLDTDADGLYDVQDFDSDGDGIADDAESSTNDTDGDGRVDAKDIDADGDGIPDNREAQPTLTYIALTGLDTDKDGWDDAYDADNGGTAITLTDTDNDGTDDLLDLDSDGDGVSDLIEANDGNADGQADQSLSGSDTDNDGLDDNLDTAPLGTGNGAGSSVVLQNTDGIGEPDYRDADDDNDGLPTLTEGSGYSQGGGIYPDYLFNPDFDGDGIMDANDLDSNNNGIPDDEESSLTAFDPTADEDGDGIMNFVDKDDPVLGTYSDTNGDGIRDEFDFDRDGIPDFRDLDSDGDGISDLAEAGGSDADGDGRLDSFTDSNNDGLDDGVALSPLILNDSDGDGLIDVVDIDMDGDGIPDNLEAQASETYIAPSGVDEDADGIDDAYDPDFGGVPLILVDTDSDGIDDILDNDSDNDGIPDYIEAFDADKDGIANVSAIGTDTDGDGLDDSFDTTVPGTGNATGSNAALQDSDGDGIADFQDKDDDGDGILTASEDRNNNGNWADDFTEGNAGNSPDYLFNGDSDGDGVMDSADLDSDNDGILNSDENGGSGFSVFGDEDGDGIYNYLDSEDAVAGALFTDTNNDGINDAFDRDKDGLADFQDLDSDNDGLPDLLEAGGIDVDNNGLVDSFTDSDNDGLVDSLDPDSGGTALPVPDSDGDGVFDAFDLDSDNNGITDLIENGQTDSDGDGRIDSFTDSDGDGLSDAYDVDSGGTPLVLLDSDKDSVPNITDLDADGDGISDLIESGGKDTDRNGVLDSFTDTDKDGLADAFDPDNGGKAIQLLDTDSDGWVNGLDADSDADGLADLLEAQADLTSPTLPLGTDSDNDGIDDAFDGSFLLPVDTDGDGIPDYRDSDSDNDGVSDFIEINDTDEDGKADVILSGVDNDNDGIDDAFDPDNGGTVPDPVAIDTDGTEKENFRDNDDDGDSIHTIDELLDVDPSNGVPDYLENNVGVCGVGFVSNNFSGNADGIAENSGVLNAFQLLGSGDTQEAVFDSNSDYIVVDLTDTVPFGETITVRYRNTDGRNTGSFDIYGSLDNITYGAAQTFTTVSTAFITEVFNVSQTSGVRYLYILRTGNREMGVDAVSYNFITCDSDNDLDGIMDSVDKDDDNDGIPDTTEGGGSNPSADADADGIANYLDPDYAGFADANGDGVNDSFDFDMDGIPNHHDLDSDNDGLVDALEANSGVLPANMTSEGSYSIAYLYLNDSNGDGWANPVDDQSGGKKLPVPDTDADGQPDYLDLDSDGDGMYDFWEGFDDNNDGFSLDDFMIRADNWEVAANNYTLYSDIDGDLDNIPNWLEDDNGDLRANFLDPAYPQYFIDSDNDGLIDLFDFDNYGVASSVPDNDSDGQKDYLQASNAVSLPVELVDFKVNVALKEVKLSWATESELNSDFFEVQRSSDLESFEALGKVISGGNSDTRLDYSYTDFQVGPGRYFYRLKAVDLDGTFKYSEILEAVVMDHTDDALIIYPNPVRGNQYLHINYSDAGALKSFTLRAINGVEVRSVDGESVKTNGGYSLPLNGLKAGMYMLEVTDSTGLKIVKKIILFK